ncbi:MAG: protein-tyrosine phosphatase [Gaiellaceae bacterium]|nr:protein-tyrosine phosphatase [Gaiellaceae bacterium]MDX6506303.1 protein-tyrosine phosphatase [Gaiellaceae bacterium]MDX6511967.1 protein-tyrosine phosphatase [Gaiellaceae bacterium]
MIDLHCHILPGIDDGAATMQSSLQMAREAVAAGVETIAATPHVRADYPTSAQTIERSVVVIGEALEAHRIPLEIIPGAELDLHFLSSLGDGELARLGLGGNPRLLLLEFPYIGWPSALATTLADLRARGLTVVLAHPERNAEVQAGPARLAPLVEAGTLVQLTAASIVGTLGASARAAALDLLDLQLAHLVAGDVHSAGSRVTRAELCAALGSEPLVEWLTREVPAAALRSSALPERPQRRRRGSWSARRLFFRAN